MTELKKSLLLLWANQVVNVVTCVTEAAKQDKQLTTNYN